MTKGVLLINLGTPDSPSTKNVRRYLREFLSDPYVIDTPALVRWLLLNLVILLTRPKKSAEAYQSIWDAERGSPLLFYSQDLCNNVAVALGDDYRVALGMRYGKPSIANAVGQLQDCDEITVLPLFPQYSLAATETAIQVAKKQLAHLNNKVTVIKDFYEQPTFIKAQAELIQTALQTTSTSSRKVIFSYHGLPERQIHKAASCELLCDMQAACPKISTQNRDCYRAQCYATSRALATQLALNESDYLTTFQSRLGRIPWIKPYTDHSLTELAKQGIKHLVIACPSFVCDCLETLEEIGMQAQEQWQAEGGETLTLVPCVNSMADWVTDLIKMQDNT